MNFLILKIFNAESLSSSKQKQQIHEQFNQIFLCRACYLILILPYFFCFQGSLQVRYRLTKEESHVFTISTENLANRRVHQVKISREGSELSVQVFHFSFFYSAYMPRLLHHTCLSFYPQPHTVVFSCLRLQSSPEPCSFSSLAL